MFKRYSVDIFNNRYISGWIFHRIWQTGDIILSFFSNDKKIGECSADNYRKDLQAKGIHPTGKCGFNFNFPSDFDVTQAATLDICLNGEKRPFLRLETAHLSPPVGHELPSLLFMHIPKTAGTSFNSFMRLQLPHEQIRIHIESLPLEKYCQLAANCSYIAGHLTLQKLKSCFDLSAFDSFTLIRDPHTHLHSHLNWLRGVGEHVNSGFFSQHNQTVQQLAKKIKGSDFSNIYKIEHFVSHLKDYELDFFDNMQTRYFLDHRPEKVSPSMLDEAEDNFGFFKHIGRTEQYSQFIKKFSSIYRIPVTDPPGSYNKAIEPALYDSADPVMQDIFSPLIETDLLLYSRIKTVFG
jgi:hypothetical protein